MKSAVPYSPRMRGPFFQAYQYIFVVPSASLASVQWIPLTLIRMSLLSPSCQLVVGAHRVFRHRRLASDDCDLSILIDLDALDLDASLDDAFHRSRHGVLANLLRTSTHD